MFRTLLARGTVLVACSVLVSTGIASAAWSKPGTGAGGGSSTSLAAPTGVNATTVAPTSSAIDVTFTPASNPTGTTYTVTRDKTAAGAVGATVVCSGLTASPCHDTGLAGSTTFTYTVSAVLGANWVKAAATTPSATTTAAVSITLTSCSDDGANNKSTCVGTYVGSITSITITWSKSGQSNVTRTGAVSGGSFSITSQNALPVTGTWSATATSTSPAATSNSVNVTIS